MSGNRKTGYFTLGIAFALAIAWLVRRRREQTVGLRDWQQVLARFHGVERARQLASAVRHKHALLVAESRLPENQALRWHLREKILPGLALYQVLLQEHSGDQSAALAEVDEAFRARTYSKSRVLFAPMQVLPNPFRLFKLIFPQMMKKFPPAGWDITYVEDSADKVAFNITRCFYLNTLTARGAPELTVSFCKCDDVMAECFPPSIRYVRLHTLGGGDELCDFQYCRVDGA